MSDNDKTQPQELLEEVIGITHGGTPKFPTVEEQREYWRQKEAAQDAVDNPYTCPKCLRRFKSPQAVRMHVARVHDKTILTVGQQGKAKTDLLSHVGRPVETLDTHRKKWSLARRRAFNKMKRRKEMGLPNTPSGMTWIPVPPIPPDEPVAMIKFCPCCGKNIERFLA